MYRWWCWKKLMVHKMGGKKGDRERKRTNHWKKKRTCTNKISACTITEVMKYSVTMVLQHLCMDIKTRIAKFCNFLGQQLYPIHRITEYDWLIYLKLKNRSIITSMNPARSQQNNNKSIHKNYSSHQTLEKRVFRQWTFCLSSTKA